MLRLVRALSFIALLVGFTIWPASAAKEKRVALVIGNAAYNHITPLSKPINDAQTMAKTLRGMGYEVILGINASKLDLEKFAQDFRAGAKGADVGIFFYSGHGFQTNRAEQQHPVNHIVPVDFDVEEIGPNLATLALDNIIETLKSETRVGLIFMDACRSDPQLAAASERMANASKGVTISRGFSPVNVVSSISATNKPPGGNGPTGLLIAYATDPGNVALEGEGQLSPFTGALVKHLGTPGLSVAEVMGRVSAEVSLETQGQQTPWNVSSLTAGTYQFLPKLAEDNSARPTAQSKSGTRSRGTPSRSTNGARGTNLPPNLGGGVGAGL
jgi:uncharacterized caspase-like protein